MGKPLFSQNLLAIQNFGRKRVCHGMGNSSMGENLFAIQTFGRKRVCRGKKNSPMHENPFTTQGFEPKMVCRGMGKQLNGRKHVQDWSIGPDESWVTVKISRL